MMNTERRYAFPVDTNVRTWIYFVMFCSGREAPLRGADGAGEWSTVARLDGKLTGNCGPMWPQFNTSEEVWRWLAR